MIRTITLRPKDGHTFTLETAMNDTFLERIFPGWKVISRKD